MTAEQSQDDVVKKGRSKLLTFLVFLLISIVLWLVIKLSKVYTTQMTFTVTYTEVPVNKWVSTPRQTVTVSFEADGFVTSALHLVGEQNRVVEIPLYEVPYRLEGGTTYSYSSQYIVDRVAEWLGIPSSDVTINEDKQYFNMEDLQSKVLPVVVPMDITTQRQYQLYGTPMPNPATVTLFGPKTVLDTMTRIYTEPLLGNNVVEDFERVLDLDLYDGLVRSPEKTATVFVDVEQYTEMEFDVPITVSDTLNLRFFPETTRLKCLVAIKDYASIKSTSFVVQVDTAQLHRLDPLLDLNVVKIPDHVQVIGVTPEQTEYLIIEDRSKK